MATLNYVEIVMVRYWQAPVVKPRRTNLGSSNKAMVISARVANIIKPYNMKNAIQTCTPSVMD